MSVKLSMGQCIKSAKEKTGLDDFGGQSFEEGLNALVDSLNKDIVLNEGTAAYFYHQIELLLTNRLEVTRLVKNHPDILDEKIVSPIFILGLPRSGTSILHLLLSLDPASRFLRNFETIGPICPPPDLIPETMDPRIHMCHKGMEGFFAVAPTLRGINGINFMAHGPAECQSLMAHEFVHMGWSTGSSLFSHGNWVGECDMEQAYRQHKLLLQVFQWKLPNERWILKAPMHLFGLERLLKIYPDAKLIFTHRDPVEAMVSGVSMVYHWTQFTTGNVDGEAISRWFPGLWSKGLKRALPVVKHMDSDRYINVYHEDLSKDPVKTVENIYDQFNLVLTDGAKKRMRTWLRDHPRSTYGAHDCSAEDFGMDPQKEKKRFDFYYDRFKFKAA